MIDRAMLERAHLDAAIASDTEPEVTGVGAVDSLEASGLDADEAGEWAIEEARKLIREAREDDESWSAVELIATGIIIGLQTGVGAGRADTVRIAHEFSQED